MYTAWIDLSGSVYYSGFWGSNTRYIEVILAILAKREIKGVYMRSFECMITAFKIVGIAMSLSLMLPMILYQCHWAMLVVWQHLCSYVM